MTLDSLKIAVMSLAAGLLAGCAAGYTTQSKTTADAQAAYAAGEQAALFRLQKPHGPVVTVVGPVRNSSLTWTSDLTVAKAILAADYVGSADPKQIMIVRNVQAVPIDLQQLLKGDDVPLLSGDLLIVRP